MRRILFAGVILGFASLLAAQEGEEVDRIVEAFRKATQQLNSLKADLDCLKVCEKMEIRETSKAKLKMKRPKKLRLDYTEPAKELRVVNGDLAWIYEPELNQAQRIDLRGRGKEVKGATPLEVAFSGNVDDLRRDYHIKMLSKEKNEKGKLIYTLELTPKNDEVESRYSSIRLKMEEGVWIPMEIITTNQSGDTVETYTLRNIESNPMILDWDFNFSPPLGTDVVNPLE